ncbi:MAG: SDR family oxidoreductase [Gemmatimonadaceae bacterium]|nr:SDR family oxidoreductase [Gemmatimonadaceae bacterium]
MTDALRGKVVLITGPARGIGAATARELASRGATLSLVGMEPELLQALAHELGGAHVWHACDVTDQAAVDDAVRETVDALGGIDVVVANAGIATNGTLLSTDIESLIRVIDVNLGGVFRIVKASLPSVIERRGYLLLVSSAAAFSAMPGLSAYGAAKAGVEQLANVLRLELAVHGVDVGSAHMSWVDTDLVRDIQADVAAFTRTISRLPGPFGTITPVGDCAAAFVRAIEARSRKVFVPTSLGRMSALRQVLGSAMVQRGLRATLAPIIQESEREATETARAFGVHSVGMGKNAPAP